MHITSLNLSVVNNELRSFYTTQSYCQLGITNEFSMLTDFFYCSMIVFVFLKEVDSYLSFIVHCKIISAPRVLGLLITSNPKHVKKPFVYTVPFSSCFSVCIYKQCRSDITLVLIRFGLNNCDANQCNISCRYTLLVRF